MKNRVFILSFLISMLSVNFVFAQPIAKKLSYQAVVRNAANELVVNQNLSVEITILNAENAPQYRETHPSVPTNQNGLLSLWVGEGTPTLGTMANVVWKDATIRSVFTLPDGSTVTQNTPVTAMPYAYFADEVDTVFLQNYLDTHDVVPDNYVTHPQLNDTMKNYLTINGLCDSIKNCEAITNLQGLIESCTTNITNNTTNITNNTTNISNITNNITQLQAADSVLSTRFAKDSIALSKRMDTMFTHMCDSIEQCEVITKLQNTDSLLGARITTDSIWSHRADSVLSTRIINDSVLFYKTDSVLLAHILNDSVLSHQVDSVLLARILIDSTNLANNYYTKAEINDTLSHYTTTDDINGLLGDYEKKSDLCNDVMNCAGIQTMQTNITNVANNLDSTKVNIRNEINSKVANLQKADSVLGARITADSIISYKADSVLAVRITTDSIWSHRADSVLSTRIINDSVLFYKTDSVLLAHILNDSILSHQVDSILLARILSDSTNLANNYYTKDKINDTLSHYSTTDEINSLLGNYTTKETLEKYLTIDGLCDSIKKCEVITNLQNADSVLSARIINDSVIFNKTDSVLLAHILNDSVLSHQVDSVLLARILSDSTNLANNYYTKDKINDTLSHYTTSDDVNNLLGNYATKDTLKNYLTIDGLCDSIKKCEVITNLQNADSVLSARIINDSVIFYKTDSVLLAHILNDSILSHQADSILLARIMSDSTNLANNYYTKDKINDTLSHYSTTDEINSLLGNYTTKETLEKYLTIDGLCDSIKKCEVITNLQKEDSLLSVRITRDSILSYKADSILATRITRDSILSYKADSILAARHIVDSTRITNNTTNITNNTNNITNITTNITNLLNADSALEARLIDTVSKLRLALKDSLSRYMDSAQVVRSIHDSIGNGTLSIKYGSNDPVIFTANQKTPSSIVIPSSEAPVYGTLILQKNGTNIDEFTANTDKTINIEVPTKLSQLANDGGTYAKRDSVNVFTAANNFTGGSITVPSNGTDIPRPADSDPTSCNNNNAVAVCDLLAVFDSLSNRIKKLEDELAAMNQPTSAVSVSLSEITRTSLKATATMNDPNLNVTSYEFCISENSSMSDDTCGTSTSNEYTFTGLKPNTVYYVTVKAYHSSGSPTSDVASGKTLPLTLDISISPASPVCLCDGNPTTVTYTANIDDADLDKYDFSWSVPDGPTPENSDERICTITYSVSASYKVTCTAILKANTTVQLTADTTITVQNCTTPTITTCETDSTVTVTSLTGNPDFIDWNDGNTGNSVSENSTHTYNNPGTYEIEVSQDGCSYKHKVAMGEAALYPCTVSAAHTNTTEYTGSSTSPGTGGLETTDSEGKVTHVADQDGNTYPVVQIGSQCWMAKNLRTTHFSNGEEIPLSQLIEIHTNDFQYNDTNNIAYRYVPALGMDYLSSWGYYYNWKAAMYEGATNINQGVCPNGWHVPSKEEWETMATVVNGSEVVFPYENHTVQAGTLAGKLSSGCTWQIDDDSYPWTVEEGSPYDYDYPERNASGFSSVPTGWVSASLRNWYDKHTYAYYWSSTINPNNSEEAYVLWWNSRYNDISLASGVMMGEQKIATSVRCVRDEMALTSYPTLSVTPSATSLLLCPGTSEDVTYTAAVVVNGETRTDNYSYTWSVTNTKTNTTTTLENHSYQVTITYSDSANYKVSCVAKANSNTPGDSATNSVMMLVRLKVAPSFTIQDPSGFTVTLNNITNTNQIVWDNNHANTTTDNLSVNQTSATHTYGAAGTYQITAYSASGCSLTQSVGIQVSVVLTSSNNTAFCPDSSTTVTYTATVDGATASEYSWEVTSDNAGGFAPAQSSGSSNSFEVTYNATGTYTVSCTATLVGGGSLGKATTTTITANEAPAFSTCVDGKWLTVGELSNVATIHWTPSGTGDPVATNTPLLNHKYDDNESAYSIKVVSSAGCKATASGDLGTTPSTYCHVQTVDQANEEYNGDKLLRVKDNAINETNWYSVVQIGSQCWMAENLRTNNTSSGGWQDPRYNNTYYRSKFGRLYKRESALSSCPTGWHLPSLAEWEQMESVVSGSTISHNSTDYVGTHASLLAGVCDWTSSDVTSSPGNHAQNTYGFRVLPAGNRDIHSPSYADYALGQYASFWCSDEGGVAWTMKFDEAGTMKDESVPASNYYISVRCVRDEAAVLPTPTMSITPNDENVSFCPESSQNVTYTATLTLDNEPVVCNSYAWSVTREDAVGFTAIQQNTQTPSFEMTYSIPGHYTVSCTATPSGYNSANASVSTTVTHKAAPSFTVSKAGRTVTLGSLQHVNTISWFENDSQHGTETNPYTYTIDETYKITVYSEDNCSIDTNVTVNALPLPVQTLAPEISAITANSMTVTPHFSGTIASYTYCYSTNNDMSGASSSGTVTETSHTFTGLNPNTTYYVQVTATNAGGSTNSTIVSAQTLTPVPSAQVDTADVTSNSFKVNATQITNATALQVCYVQSTEECPNDIDTCATENDVANVSNTTQTIENLTASTSYCVIVKVSNAYSTTIYGPWKVTTKAESSGGGDNNVSPVVDKKSSCVIKKANNQLESEAVTSLSSPANWSSTSGTEAGREDNTYIVVDSIRDDDDEVHWYKVVQIGTQCWMAENMRAKNYGYNTNSELKQYPTYVSDNDINNSKYYYDYPSGVSVNSSNERTYGLLYSWHAATNNTKYEGEFVRGICPEGWHVPCSDEWTAMESAVCAPAAYSYSSGWGTQDIAGALSTGTWASSTNSGAPGNSSTSLNTSGFSAHPAGYVIINTMDQPSRNGKGERAFFWTSSESDNDSNKSWDRQLWNSQPKVKRVENSKKAGRSVRCVRDTVPAEQQGGGGEQETPTINRKLSCVLAGTDNHITTNHPSINTDKYSNNKDIEKGRDLGNGIVVLDSVSDFEGNWYKVVQIGTQCWLKENMRAQKYSSGSHSQLQLSTSKPTKEILETLSTPNQPQPCWAPNLNDNNISTYGLYYNWGAVMNIATSDNPEPTEGLQGICPKGWHVPSLTEWNTMIAFVDEYYDPNYDDGRVTGILSSENIWSHTNMNNINSPYPKNANYPYLNASGFSAIPAGAYVCRGNNTVSGPWFEIRAQFWTSTLSDGDNSGTCLYWTGDYNKVQTVNGVGSSNYSAAASVRCVRNQ